MPHKAACHLTKCDILSQDILSQILDVIQSDVARVTKASALELLIFCHCVSWHSSSWF